MSALFSEIYGCYYGVVAKILKAAQNGVSRAALEDILKLSGFDETAFHLMPELTGGSLSLLERRDDGLYYSVLAPPLPARPLTFLERSYLASLLCDTRIRLFLDGDEIERLTRELCAEPLFDIDDIAFTDKYSDGDSYADPVYVENFKAALTAIKNGRAVEIVYSNKSGRETKRIYHPYKLCYSELNDKFRILCAVFNNKTKGLSRVTLNLGRAVSIKIADTPFCVPHGELEKLFSAPVQNPPVKLEISTERNALERFMLQFASFERRTEYDCGRNVYICSIYYDTADETELLINILSFGALVRVLEPQDFLSQIKERVQKQIVLLGQDA